MISIEFLIINHFFQFFYCKQKLIKLRNFKNSTILIINSQKSPKFTKKKFLYIKKTYSNYQIQKFKMKKFYFLKKITN